MNRKNSKYIISKGYQLIYGYQLYPNGLVQTNNATISSYIADNGFYYFK